VKEFLILAALMLAPTFSAAAEQGDATIQWQEDFSDEVALKKSWSKYDTLLPADKTQRFWQLEGGVLRGRAFAKVHPVGLMRTISGTDVRLKFRVKPGAGAEVYANIMGPLNGADRVVPERGDIHLRRAGLHVLTASGEFAPYDEWYTHPSAEAQKDPALRHTDFKRVMVKAPMTANEWHDITIEMRDKQLTIWSDGKQVSSYQTHSGDDPKVSISIAVGNGSKSDIVDAWFDDVSVEHVR
jgi:hypothetical protein